MMALPPAEGAPPMPPPTTAPTPWTCENCGHEHSTEGLDALLRCEICDEKRYLAPRRSGTADAKSSQQSNQVSDASDAEDELQLGLLSVVHVATDNMDDDVRLCHELFGEGSVTFTRLDSLSAPQALHFIFEPFKVIPRDVCTAWGLHSTLQLTLSFEDSAAYESRRIDKATLWHPGRGEDGTAIAANDDGCIVAQQLLRIIQVFWESLAADAMRGGEEHGIKIGSTASQIQSQIQSQKERSNLSAVAARVWRSVASLGAVSPADCSAAAALAALEYGGSSSGSHASLTSVMPRRMDGRHRAREEALDFVRPAPATISYVISRLRSLNAYCAICDEPHPFGAMLQPTVCQRPLCMHQFASFGRLLVGATSLATHAEVLDLLIATTTLAATSARAADILTPMPWVPAQRGSSVLALDPEKPNLPLTREILGRFPAFERINAAAYGDGTEGLRRLMDAQHPLALGLFEWIVSSNRAHLVSVPEALKLASLGTRHQFVMLSAPPERQAAFEELKRQYGSKFAWHGSSSENWHSILRTGLRNLSNTKLMTTGAAYGAGVYLSTSAIMSLGFAMRRSGVFSAAAGGVVSASAAAAISAGAAAGGNAFLAGSELNLLALCEVAQVPSLRKTQAIWVAPEENAVVTRFLFAFPNGVYTRADTLPQDSTDPKFEEDVRNCIGRLDMDDERAVMTDSTAEGFTLVYREQSFMPPPTAPGAHDAGIEYGVLAADSAADNMAALHIAAADEHAVMTDSTAEGFTLVGSSEATILPYQEQQQNAWPDFSPSRLPSMNASEADSRQPSVVPASSSSAKIGGWLRAGQGREARASEQHAPVMAARAPQPPPSQPHSEGDTELSRRLDALQADGWQRVDVVGDGNCFFRALAKQVDGDEQLHGRARQETIRYMREHREEFEQFVHIYSDINYKDFDSYVDNTSIEGTYVEGEIELMAAAKTFNVRIRVYGRSEDHDRTFAPLISNDETRDVCMAHDQAAQHYFVLERMGPAPIARGGLPRPELPPPKMGLIFFGHAYNLRHLLHVRQFKPLLLEAFAAHWAARRLCRAWKRTLEIRHKLVGEGKLTLRADHASARDALERASSGEIQLQAIELEGRVRELGDAKGALQAVSVHVVARHREAEELKLRIAATEQQRAAVAKEHEWCLRRLASLRGQCESYAGTLREKQHELHSATQELEALAREVTAVQTRMASQLDEAHALNRALITAREEVRALKQSQALLLQQAHVESKQVAPLHLELSQLTAEIGVLQQQIDATVANVLSADGRPTAPAVEYPELSRQPPVSFSPAMSVAQSAAGSPETGLSHLSSAWSAQPPGPPTREQSFKAQPFRPPPFTPSVDPKRAWRGAEIGSVELSRPAERPAEPSSKPEKPTRRRHDRAPKQVGVLAFLSSNGDSSLHASAHHGALPPHRWASLPSSRPQATAARSAACRHWTVAARLRLRSTRFCRPPPHYRPHHR